MTSFFDPDECLKGLSPLISAGDVFEIRALNVTKSNGYAPLTAFGVFDSIGVAIEEVAKFCGQHEADGWYFSPNHLIPGVLSRSPNKIVIASKSDVLAGDRDVLSRMWLLIDLDYQRPAGTAASDLEVGETHAAAKVLYAILKPAFGCHGILFDSGNGRHLLFRIDVPCEDNGLISRVLQTSNALLKERCDLPVHVDVVTANPARIWKLPGSFSRKGYEVPSQQRFHRMAKLLWRPDVIEVVPREKLEAFAPQEPEKPKHVSLKTEDSPRSETVSASEWLATHGISVSVVKPWQDATAYVLDECPFNPQHRAPDSMLLEFPNNRIVFKCLHQSCSANGWWNLRDLMESGWKEKRKQFPGFADEGRLEHFRSQLRCLHREEFLFAKEYYRKGKDA